MADSYLDTFEARGDLYNEAAQINPRAREIERRILIDLLRLEPHHTICDAPAGGGYLADGIRPLLRQPDQIICVEPSKKFSNAISPSYITHVSPLDRLPLPDDTIDRVGSLAGLHHLADKSLFFREAYRALKPGGLFAVGDVMDGSPVAYFLNGSVDRHTETGHKGIFLKRGECRDLLESAGFNNVHEEERQFAWTFRSVGEMVRYCRSLFGMVRATEDDVHEALYNSFAIVATGGEVRLPWSLLYGTGMKRS